MTWTLYSSPRSPFVRKVLIAAHELGLADVISRVDVVTNPMAPAPELDGVNPMGMIPTLVVEGEVIFDSCVIIEMLNDQAGGMLFGVDPGIERRDILTRHAMANAAMDKATRIIDEMFREQNADTQAHKDGFQDAILRTIGWMQPRLSAARFDTGDIAFAALLSYLDFRFSDIDWGADHRSARDWLTRVETRPSMQATGYAAN